MNLRSGLFGKARFLTGQKPGITVLKRAIIERGQLSSVFVVDTSSIARLRLIKTGKSFGDRVEVLSGLNENEQVVIEGAQELSDGSPVEREEP
jgi:hypothetical protein